MRIRMVLIIPYSTSKVRFLFGIKVRNVRSESLAFKAGFLRLIEKVHRLAGILLPSPLRGGGRGKQLSPHGQEWVWVGVKRKTGNCRLVFGPK